MSHTRGLMPQRRATGRVSTAPRRLVLFLLPYAFLAACGGSPPGRVPTDAGLLRDGGADGGTRDGGSPDRGTTDGGGTDGGMSDGGCGGGDQACTELGASACHENRILECSEVGGCLLWTVRRDCSGEGLDCVSGASSP